MRAADMHCDTIGRIYAEPGTCLAQNAFHIDLDKMRRGDYLMQNFAMFVDLGSTDDAWRTCTEMIDCFDREMDANADVIRRAGSWDDVERNSAEGLMSAVLTVEEGGVLKGDIRHLQELYDRGVRMMTLTWNYENELGFSAALASESPDGSRMGLKPFGVEVVRRMEELGMIVDVSHLSDAGFYDVLANTTKPFTASHSNARALCGHSRNLTDDMIRRLADRGGVTGLNFCSAFLEDGSRVTRLSALAAHARHIVDVGGIEVLGLGSDLDGIGSRLEMKDASGMPMLADALHKEGFTESEIDCIFYKNVRRLYHDCL